MNEHSFVSKIITQASYHNPEAFPNEILQGIVNLMENEILPAVFTALSLPEFPSAMKVFRESRDRRRKKRFRRKASLEETRVLIQQLEYIKRRLIGYRDSSSIEPMVDFSDFDNFMAPYESNRSLIRERLEFNGEPMKVAPVERPSKPYVSTLPPTRVKHQINLSQDIQDRIMSDSLFENVFKAVETEIRELAPSHPFEILEVSLHSDCELPDWERTILTLTLPPMSFENKMRLWQRYDIRIRKRIAEVASQMDKSHRKRVEALNKNLFIHVDLT
ncbi:MAG: hypothetical protein OEZ29_01625 [Candidatus Bathyarchaeota archaeon]|nr:hypothetical protein [Candidatus Bathyarchaeota archaeon]MDH5779276.1 hypothetical protein [Candidatus Bathyarchaeota archaeon]